MKIAIVGAGISGLGCALALNQSHRLSLFETGSYLGGHANTVDVTLDGKSFGVDTGFLVYNERTYPKLIRMFSALNVKVDRSEMTFSVSRRDKDREWCGSSLGGLFAQPSNAFSPSFSVITFIIISTIFSCVSAFLRSISNRSFSNCNSSRRTSISC